MRCISCAEFSHLYWTLGKKHRRLPSPRATASVSKRSPPHFLRVCSGLPDGRGSRNAPLRGGEQTTEEESRYSTEIEPGGPRYPEVPAGHCGAEAEFFHGKG